MSTRAVIAVERDGVRVGRYLHFGHPDDARANLARILARDGYADAVRVLVDERAAWSSIDAGQVLGASGERYVPVAGYGLAYADEPWTDPEPVETFDAEWVYLLTPDGLLAEPVEP